MVRPKKYWKKPDRLVLISTLLLILFGLVAVSSASAVLSFQRFGNNNYYFFRQIIFACLGLAAMYLASRIDYHVWHRWSRPILLAGILLLALVLIPTFGFKPTVARSWFKIGDFLMQPSEFVKLAVIFYLASWFARKPNAQNNFLFGILPPLLVIGASIILIALEPDIGTAAMIAVIMLVIFFVAGAKIRYLASVLGAGVAGLWVLIKAAPYRAARIITFLDPSLDPRGIGYHINQALLAIGSGGFWGYGLGGSLQKHNYLPEPIGDSIFAVMAEELGFIRIVFVVLLFAVLVFGTLRLAKRAPDDFGRLCAIGIVGWIGMQALINIGAITGLMPLTGITLPFLSYGGSSLLASCFGIGVILNISRQRI
jgi:cell division protein FtsW